MKKIFLLLAFLTLSVGLWAQTQTVSYRYPVYNIDGDATSGVKEWRDGSAEAIRITGSESVLGKAGTETWYYVDCLKFTEIKTDSISITIKNGLDIKGTVHLILCDMPSDRQILTIGTPNTNRPGINTEGATLVIYGQKSGSGILAAYGGEGASGDYYNGSPGIGSCPTTSDDDIPAPGGTVIINGGTVMATGGNGGAGIGGAGSTEGTGGMGGTVIINGGTVEATGVYGAGIGGGRHGSGGTVTINGGTVTAKSEFGAGIGGGSSVSYGDKVYGGTVTINGGTVTALGGGRASSGIGAGGRNGIGAKLTINGGTVTAQGCYPYGGYESVDIGGPYSTTNASTDVMTTVTGGALNASVIVDKVAISGGIFAQKPQDEWLMDGCSVISNEDAATKAEYPWAIERRSWYPWYITAYQDPANKDNYYSTFYSGTDAYQVPEDVTAYTGVVNDNVLKLTTIADGIIPAGEGVILRLTTEDNTATTKQIALAVTSTTTAKSDNNALTGTDVAIDALGENDYALSFGQNGVGFYLWNGKPIGANEAYLTLETNKVKAFTFQFEDASSIHNSQFIIHNSENDVMYNLNGMRVDESYKGIVIKNGKKIYWRGQSE